MELEKDLAARQEARDLCRRATLAHQQLANMEQGQLDRICQAIAKAFSASARELAELAVQETGFGNTEDKTAKNKFASDTVWDAIKQMQMVGILEKDEEKRVWQIGVPVGVIAAIVPSTNPTSTICYKALIALKAGNSIVFSPHPKALSCSIRTTQIVAEAAEAAGAPKGSISCLRLGAMAGTQELMADPGIKLILATGGPAMVRAAYSSGKPAIGVGAGNGPAYIHHSADVNRALECILCSKSFDNGTVCASEQSIIVEKAMEQKVLSAAKGKGFYLMGQEEAVKLSKLLFRPSGALNPEVVGKSAEKLAEMAGFSIPRGTKVLMAREEEAGPTRPYSMEKLCPVLAFYVMETEAQVLEKSVEILRYEGSGHTFCMHCEDLTAIERFARKIPVSRFLVNTPAALGGIGKSTGLFPALTLGCGAVGGSSSSNNISPMDLINVRRVAWDTDGSGDPLQPDSHMVEMLVARIMERLR